MVLDPQFLDLMPYTVTVENPAGFSGAYGGRSYAASFGWQCRIEQESKLFKAKDGREVRCNATLFGPPWDSTTGQTAVTIAPTAKITLPSGLIIAGSSQPPVLYVGQNADAEGTMYYEVLI